MTGLESMDCLHVTDENKLLKARARLFTIYFYDTDSYAVNLLGKKAGYSWINEKKDRRVRGGGEGKEAGETNNKWKYENKGLKWLRGKFTQTFPIRFF